MKRFRGLVLLATLGLLLVGGAYIISPSPSVETGNNIFSSFVYPHYMKKLQTFLLQHPHYEAAKAAIPSSFNSGVRSLIEEMERPVETSLSFREMHQSWVKKLRALIPLFSQEESPSSLLVADLIRWIYLEVDLQTENSSFFYSYALMPTNADFSYLKEARDRLKQGKIFSGMEYKESHEDNFFHGNLPYVLFTHPTAATRIIRSGHPTGDFTGYRYKIQSPTVYPEFLAFLHLQLSHVYVNVMKRKGLEGPATRAIEQLEQTCPSIYVVTLDKNSSFYWQAEKQSPELMDSEAFKKEFIDQMMADKGDYYWSSHLDRPAWKEELKTILSTIHARYFDQQPTLNRIERQDFIELSYLAILDALVETWKPASMNISCRQGMDRGPSLAVLWMLQKSPLDVQTFAPLLLAPPLLIHNRPSHPSRIDRFVSAAKRF